METINRENKQFNQRLDFYWQALLIYFTMVVIYSFTRGSLLAHNFDYILNDPLVELFGLFILVSIISYLFKYFTNRSIIIGDDFFILKNRFREKKYELSDIKKIFFGKENKMRNRDSSRIVVIKLASRRRKLRIRPAAYWDDKELFEALGKLKSKLG